MSEDTYAEKIAKLLRKAENTDVEAEAETFFAAAQRLMSKYAIDEAMLAKARGENMQATEKIVQTRIIVKGRYRKPLAQLVIRIAEVNFCRPIYTYTSEKSAEALYVNGFESDVERVKLLNTSLQLQAVGSMNRWWKTEKAENPLIHGSRQGFYARRDYMFGFVRGVAEKLNIAADEAKKAAEETAEANEAGTSSGVALALRDKAAEVNDWIDQTYGKLGTKRGGNLRGSGTGARAAGTRAGRTANTGTTGIGGGSRGALTA